MSTHNIGFYEDLTKNYLSNYHQICTLSLNLFSPDDIVGLIYMYMNERKEKVITKKIRNFNDS